MKLKFIAATLLAAASFGASAADQTVTLTVDKLKSFSSIDTVLDGGDDLISFDGLGAGKYNLVVTLSSQNITWDQTATLLSGTTSVVGEFSGKKLQFADFDYSGKGPFSLLLAGVATNSLKAYGYSADVTVTALPVPEPETYGMLLGGLALLGAVARRKAKKAA
ncbi:MAG: FxDxF family PEP-CTERM protein [Sphingomonadaceae bacterium]